MAEKDAVLKDLLKEKDVFADVFNNLLFEGVQLVKPENLILADISSAIKYNEDGSLHERTRDVAMFDVRHGVILCLLGIENEASQKRYEILRIVGYDGSAYQEQVAKLRAAESKKKHSRRIL